MNIIDIGIVIFLLFGMILGFKRGFTTELIKTIGFILVVILAYLFKGSLSNFLYEHLPFINFGFLKGAAILNILVYEVLAFIICVIVLSLVLKLILVVSRVFEKVLNATIVLGIPSKLAGAVVGFIHEYIILFIILYILTLVGINVDMVNNSKLRDKIVNETPILSKLCDNSLIIIDEFKNIKNDFNNSSISNQDFNYKAMELFLKYKVVSSESASKLIKDGKLDAFDNYQDLLNEYKEV